MGFQIERKKYIVFIRKKKKRHQRKHVRRSDINFKKISSVCAKPVFVETYTVLFFFFFFITYVILHSCVGEQQTIQSVFVCLSYEHG